MEKTAPELTPSRKPESDPISEKKVPREERKGEREEGRKKGKIEKKKKQLIGNLAILLETARGYVKGLITDPK